MYPQYKINANLSSFLLHNKRRIIQFMVNSHIKIWKKKKPKPKTKIKPGNSVFWLFTMNVVTICDQKN